MLDFASRALLAAGTLGIVARSVWMLHNGNVKIVARRTSILVIGGMVIPGAIFWIVLLLSGYTVDAELQWDVWLSRFAWFWVLAGAFVLQSLIKQAEGT